MVKSLSIAFQNTGYAMKCLMGWRNSYPPGCRDARAAAALRYSFENIRKCRVGSIDGNEIASGSLSGWLAIGQLFDAGKKIPASNDGTRFDAL
jgi:hypothetical protein